jgi:glycosyltransferase involved in cell wall biosynthesis
VDSLAEAILRMHQNADERRRQAARARAFLTNYGWDRQGAELVSMYEQLLEN